MGGQNLKVGLVGYGLAGRVFHTPLYKAAGIDLVAVASSDSEKVHADHPGVVVHPTAAALFHDRQVELVVLASPSFTHAPLMLEALAAGKHVLSDKPFTATVAEADAVIAAAEKADRIASCYQNRRFDADFLTLRNLIDKKELGEIHHFESHFDRYNPLPKDRWQERPEPGVGLHYDLGAHLIDQALLLFGMPDWVQGDLQKQRDGSAIVDQFHLRMGKGNLRIELTAGMLVADHKLRFRVHGSKASWQKLYLDPQEDQIWHQGLTPADDGYGLEDESRYGTLTSVVDGAMVSARTPAQRGCWPEIYAGLKRAIQHGSAPPVTALEARNTIAVIEALVRSSATGQRVEITG